MTGETITTERAGERAVTLMADGYEILRPVKGTSKAMGTDALMGKPATDATMHPPFRMTREVFNAYRANGWIQKLKPYKTKGWQAWRITEAGRHESMRRPRPTRDEIQAARMATLPTRPRERTP